MTVCAGGRTNCVRGLQRKVGTLPQTPDYLYDEESPAKSKKSSSQDNDPPDSMELSEAWVVAVVRSGISSEEECVHMKPWPRMHSMAYQLTNGLPDERSVQIP